MTTLIVRVSVAVALALFAAAVSRRACAATRHTILSFGLVATILIPLLALFMPSVPLQWLDAPQSKVFATVAATPGPFVVPEAHEAAPDERRFPAGTIWFSGAALLLLIRLTSWIRAYALVRRSSQRQGFASDIRFSAAIAQPAAFRGSVILPEDAAEWEASRLELVVAHERAHVDRHDVLWQAVGDVACAVWWFHPLVWITAMRAAVERERACDDRVLSDGAAADQYASTILAFARSARAHFQPAPGMAEATHIGERIAALLDVRLPRAGSRIAQLLIAATAAAAIPILASVAPGIARPFLGEPDLLGDAVASPFSERVPGFDEIPPVEAEGEDAALISFLQYVARNEPRHSIDFVPARARWALAQVRGGRLVLPLLASLSDDDWRVRTYAAWALGVARDARATNSIIPLLREPTWRVRAMAANALWQIGDRDAEAAMLAALDDPAWQVRVSVVRYLAHVDPARYRATLHAMRADRHIAVRTAAESGVRRP